MKRLLHCSWNTVIYYNYTYTDCDWHMTWWHTRDCCLGNCARHAALLTTLFIVKPDNLYTYLDVLMFYWFDDFVEMRQHVEKTRIEEVGACKRHKNGTKTAQKRLSKDVEWTSWILFTTGMKLSDGSIGTGGCLLDCRYSAEKMISGIEAHRHFASVSTRISIGEKRFRSRIDSGKLEFLVKDTIVRTHTMLYFSTYSSRYNAKNYEDASFYFSIIIL